MPDNTPLPVDRNVPGYVEKLTWLESLEAPSEQRSRRLAARAWSGLWPIGLAILIVLAVWQLIHLSGWKKAIFPSWKARTVSALRSSTRSLVETV